MTFHFFKHNLIFLIIIIIYIYIHLIWINCDFWQLDYADIFTTSTLKKNLEILRSFIDYGGNEMRELFKRMKSGIVILFLVCWLLIFLSNWNIFFANALRFSFFSFFSNYILSSFISSAHSFCPNDRFYSDWLGRFALR